VVDWLAVFLFLKNFERKNKKNKIIIPKRIWERKNPPTLQP